MQHVKERFRDSDDEDVEPIRLSLYSDGTGVILIDQDGRRLSNTTSVHWSFGVDGKPTVSLTLFGVPVKIDYECEPVGSVALLDSEELQTRHAEIVKNTRPMSLDEVLEEGR